MEDNEIMVTEINEGAVEEATDEGSKAASIGGLAAIIAGAAAGVALLTKFVIIPLVKKVKEKIAQQQTTEATDENGEKVEVEIQEKSEK